MMTCTICRLQKTEGNLEELHASKMHDAQEGQSEGGREIYICQGWGEGHYYLFLVIIPQPSWRRAWYIEAAVSEVLSHGYYNTTKAAHRLK